MLFRVPLVMQVSRWERRVSRVGTTLGLSAVLSPLGFIYGYFPKSCPRGNVTAKEYPSGMIIAQPPTSTTRKKKCKPHSNAHVACVTQTKRRLDDFMFSTVNNLIVRPVVLSFSVSAFIHFQAQSSHPWYCQFCLKCNVSKTLLL